MTQTTTIGQYAEAKVAEKLMSQGWTIHKRNWRTRVCEIDLIAEHKQIMYFVEVKYRKSANYGSGLDYITPKKLRQMTFAAELWIQQNKWTKSYQLAAVEVAGSSFEVGELITDF